MMHTIHDKNATHQAFMWNDDQHRILLHWESFILKTFAYGNTVLINMGVEMIKWAAFGHNLSSVCLLLLSFVIEWNQSKRIYLNIIKKESLIFFQMKIIFFMFCDTINPLRKYLQLFEDKVFIEFSVRMWLYFSD